MGERDAADVRDENHEATGFFPANGHNPAGPSLSLPPAPPRHSRRPLLVIPAVFSGNPVKTVFLQGSIRESYPFDKASMAAES